MNQRSSVVAPASIGLGRPISEAAIARWDIDVRPDGRGLPAGKGSVHQGSALYAKLCAACHGPTGAESIIGPRLVGGVGSLAGDKPIKTVASYWPYATTLFDYIRRAMPFTAPQSLTNNETYALSAYLLHRGGIIGADVTLDAASLTAVVMPNRSGFISPDPRPDVSH